jgi:hypothetical protein
MSGPKNPKGLLLIPGVIVAVLLFFGVLSGSLQQMFESDAAARQAMQAAYRACEMGHSGEYARRVVDARAEIDKLSPVKAHELNMDFLNGLRVRQCPTRL